MARYQKRLSGPLIDRIDIHVDVPRVNYDKLAADLAGADDIGPAHLAGVVRANRWDTE